ncbi:MAG: efflux RND transporter periplasmic adaptor subunit [Acidobacteria bacterium]|nr:efflux RND transporter periplasmic adaptor subunit [Acidobacteriota bacterium]
MRRILFSGSALLRIFVIFTAALMLSACGTSGSAGERRASNADSGASQDAVIVVTTAKTEARGIQAYVQATGSLVADETSNVAPKVAGKIANVFVDAGQFVGQGAIIAKIEDREARLRLAEAQAGVKQAQAGVRQAEARLGLSANGRFEASTIPEVRSANSNLEQAQAELRQAEANEKRYRELVETGDTPLITYEQYRTNRDTARARVNAARQALEAQVNVARQNNQAIASARANVEAAQAQVATAQQAVADTEVRAPFSGFVSERGSAVGEYVTSSTTIATVLRTNPIKAQIQIAESDVPNVALGRGVSVRVDAYRDRSFAGTVTAVNPAVDPTSRSTIVEASIENGDNSLRPGMFATARITREGGGTGIFVPKSAVHNDQTTQSFRAFVILDGVAKLRVLQLGTEEGEYYQVLNGLGPDETVATSNVAELYEGARVAV